MLKRTPLLWFAAIVLLAGISTPSHAVVNVTSYGAVANDGLDDKTAFQNAINAAWLANDTVYIPNGTYDFTANGGIGLIIYGPVVIEGQSKTGTILKANTTSGNNSFNAFFWIRNVSDVTIKNLTLQGNGKIGKAIGIYLDNANPGTPYPNVTGPIQNHTITNCKFSNFTTDYWIHVLNLSTTNRISNLVITDNEFVSAAGNAINPSNLASNSSAIGLLGSNTSALGLIYNFAIDDNTFQAQHIKSGILCYAGTRYGFIRRNIINGAGASGAIPYNSGAYAIQIYNSAYTPGPPPAVTGGSRPTEIFIDYNTITNPRTCGIYVAAANLIYMRYNNISGQTDTGTALPYGALGINSNVNVVATNNTLTNNHYGLNIVQPTTFQAPSSLAPYGVSTANNTITVRNNGIGVWVRVRGGNPHPNTSVQNTTITALGTGSKSVLVQSPSTTPRGTVQFRDVYQTGFTTSPLRNMRCTDYSNAPLPGSFFSSPNLFQNILYRPNSGSAYTTQTVFY